MLLHELFFLCVATAGPITSRDVTLSNAETAFKQLQQWYDSSTGLWQEMWWHSGSIVSTICNLATVDQSLKDQISSILSETYNIAQRYSYPAKTNQGFIGDYYDDEGWWALGWLDAYDLTGNQQYHSAAETIYQDMLSAFGKTSCSQDSGGQGGIPWGKSSTYINSIANELFLTLAARLGHTDVASKQWNWMKGTGLIRNDNLIVDGLLSDCSAGRTGWEGNIWSYNQGVLLPALAQLNDVDSAHAIVRATITYMAPNGILRDSCEHNSTANGMNTCDGDQTQFKGIFVRNLIELQRASPRQEYADFLRSNAESLWTKGQEEGVMSVFWDGPFVSPANASTQSSGLDLLVAAVGGVGMRNVWFWQEESPIP